MALLDARGLVIDVNQALADVVGIGATDLIGADLRSFAHPSDPTLTHLAELVDGRRSSMSADVCLDPAIVHTHGADVVWVRLHVAVLDDDDAEPSYLVQLTDITERKQLAESLRVAEERARACIDSLDQGVILSCPREGVLRSNPAAARILGCQPEEVSDRWLDPEAVILDEQLQRIERDRLSSSLVRESGESISDRIEWLQRADGTWVRIRLSCTPYGWANELVFTLTDVTRWTPAAAPRPDGVVANTADSTTSKS